MAWHLFGAKPLPKTMLTYCQLDSQEHISMKFNQMQAFSLKKCIWNIVCKPVAILFLPDC